MEKIFCEEQIKPELSEDTLAHYGVLGMKWGVRHDPERAFAKASDKAAKLKKKAGIKNQKRVQKKSKKAAKATKKYIKSLDSPFASDKKVFERAVKKDKAQYKMDKAVSKAAKATKKETRWDRAMVKAFANEYDRINRTAKTDEEKDSRLSKLENAYSKVSVNPEIVAEVNRRRRKIASSK